MRPDKRPDRLERIAMALLLSPEGISEREIMISENITSGRNEVNKLEPLLDIKFKREWENTADGYGQYYRYSIPNREVAQKLIKYVNAKAHERMNIERFDERLTEIVLNGFPYIGEM
ncbi:hypothetical protein [Lonepinella sp. BR2474]|uniref:hypothetical protein n=1 Tax=Lonepinella sp. BR2474 TaxID=3434548 RepID=UPI003F6E1366